MLWTQFCRRDFALCLLHERAIATSGKEKLRVALSLYGTE